MKLTKEEIAILIYLVDNRIRFAEKTSTPSPGMLYELERMRTALAKLQEAYASKT